jgi:hypothetical protein
MRFQNYYFFFFLKFKNFKQFQNFKIVEEGHNDYMSKSISYAVSTREPYITPRATGPEG